MFNQKAEGKHTDHNLTASRGQNSHHGTPETLGSDVERRSAPTQTADLLAIYTNASSTARKLTVASAAEGKAAGLPLETL